ncbi:TonB-dependent receptor plug domain-containing protein [Novosphingobium aquiterrae]|uniref:TonB-dependent receptor plug domain-containing protein n=1 Tax=Novosphingobium aquiterrae TaxID=624388 RepID=A0ABV6PG70_9SPHN
MRSSAIRRGRSAALAATATATAMSFFLATPAFAQTAATDEAKSDEPSIVVIGTRRTDRTQTDSASPVDVIGAAELTSQPTANMIDAVKNIVPSFYVGQNSISDASTFVRAPSLRGLPSDQVLVMLNGKRFNRSALVQVYVGGDTGLSFGSHGSDLSSLPTLAFKSLEVLRDGATAQYGSDAIAGVLNYGLRDDAGIEMVARYGQYYKGDGESYQIAANVGTKIGDRGFINVTGEYDDDGQTSRGETRPIAAALATNFPSLASQLPHYPLPAQIWGSSPGWGWKAVVNAEYELSDSAKFYAFGNFAHAKADQSFNYRPYYPGSVTLQRDSGAGPVPVSVSGNANFNFPYYLTNCPTGSATCLAGGVVQDTNVFNLNTLYPAGFTPRFVGKTDQAFGVAGIKGDMGKLNYDLSASLSRNQLDLSMYNSINFSYGPQSQTAFQFGKLIQKEFNANLDLTYELDAGLASPLTVSGGLEYRRETYTSTEGDVQSYAAGPFALSRPLYTQTSPGVYALVGTSTNCSDPGAVCTRARSPAASGYGGTSPVYAGTSHESSYGAYIGLEGDLTDTLSMGLAARLEHYDSFGEAVVSKVNAIWHATPQIALRGTIGTGFHAPSPGQNNTQVLTTNFRAGNAIQTGTFPVTSAIAQYYGAIPLKPEKSTNYGVGLVLEPTSNINLTIDLYSIQVRDRIFISQTYTVTPGDITALPELASVGDGGDVNYFTNALDTSTRGIDVVGTYRTDLADGKLNLTLAYNYNENTVKRSVAGTISPEQIDVIKNLAPHHRLNLTAGWTMGDFGLNLAGHYYSSWRAETDYPGQTFGAKVTADAEVSYTFMDHFTLAVGANNLFDTYPDRIKATADNPIFTLTNSTADGQVYPRMGGPFGFNGGFWYARLKVKY